MNRIVSSIVLLVVFSSISVTVSASVSSGSVSTLSCTQESRRCNDGSPMPRDEKTCEWKAHMCKPLSIGVVTTSEIYTFAFTYGFTRAKTEKLFSGYTPLTHREAQKMLLRTAYVLTDGDTSRIIMHQALRKYFQSNQKMTRYDAYRLLTYILEWTRYSDTSILDSSRPMEYITRFEFVGWVYTLYQRYRE